MLNRAADHVRSLALLASIAALALVGSGCTGRPDYRRVELTDSAGVPLSAIPSVEVENVRGIVTVTVDPRISRPEVVGNVYPEASMTKTMRESARNASGFTAEVVQTEGRPVVRVRANPPEGMTETAAVEIEVRLPACHGVTVRNAGGAVRLIGVSGPITVENGVGGQPGGMVIVRTGETMTDPVTLTTTSGDIYFQIPTTSSGRMDLLSLDGEAELRAQGGRLTEVAPTYSWYRGVLNAGTNPVTLRSGKGMVRVTVLDNASTHVPAE